MRRVLLLICTLLPAIYFFVGCEKKIVGKERENVPPVVHFVNIPIEGAKFSSDTTVYWYGMDVDGFITHFKYAVVESTIVGDPVTYIQTTPDTSIGWIVLEVELDNPQTNAKIKMSADISDPVRKYVASYVFLQAVDNLGAKSEVVYRLFRKNNHFPNTEISVNALNDPYVNAVTRGGALKGVSISWSASDPIDYPRNPPPFEFQWGFYGPYDSLQMVALDSICTGSLFVDIYGDFYYSGDLYPVVGSPDTTIDTMVTPPETTIIVDTTWILVDTLGRGNAYGDWQEMLYLDSIPDYLDRLVDSSYDALSGETWVYDGATQIYDVYKDFPVDTTSQYNFLFWCQTRDDSKVPDPVPAYSWLSVIDPKFEREVIVLDITSYKKVSWNWPVFPKTAYSGADYWDQSTVPVVKKVIGEMINTWKGGDVFDIDDTLEALCYEFDRIEYCIPFGKFHATQDYYPIGPLTKPWMSTDNRGIMAVTLRDILKHKIIILFNDDVGSQVVTNSPQMLEIFDGLNAGMSCWAMLRDPFVDFVWAVYPTPQNVPQKYQTYFGVSGMRHTCWQGTINRYLDNPGIRIEDFIGAHILPEFQPDFPYLPVDTTLLEDRYLWIPGGGFFQYQFRCPETGEILIGAYPEIGYIQKHPFAEAVYLYHSKYRNEPAGFRQHCGKTVGIYEKYEGAVVGIRYDTQLFRTAHFSFSLLPIQSDSAQMAFSAMMDWLADQTYLKTGRLASGSRAKVNVNELTNISRELHELKRQGLLRSIVEE